MNSHFLILVFPRVMLVCKQYDLLNPRFAPSSIIVLCITTDIMLLVAHKDKHLLTHMSSSLTL